MASVVLAQCSYMRKRVLRREETVCGSGVFRLRLQDFNSLDHCNSMRQGPIFGHCCRRVLSGLSYSAFSREMFQSRVECVTTACLPPPLFLRRRRLKNRLFSYTERQIVPDLPPFPSAFPVRISVCTRMDLAPATCRHPPRWMSMM